MTHSAVLIVPEAMKPAADAVGAAMGWGLESYTIALGDGEKITHFGCRADVSAQFVQWVRGHEPLPDPAAAPVIATLTADFSPDPDDAARPVLWGRAHLDAVLCALELREMGDSAA